MFWQRVRFALFVGVCTAAATTARAGDCGDCAAPAPCAPAMKTVTCYEMVPEKYMATRTSYKVECREEKYTAYKCECYTENAVRTVTCYKSVPEYKTCVRNVCVCTPCYEERTIMQCYTVCQPVTKMVKKCVDQGHWECKCVECKPSCLDKLKKCCHKHDCCCEECPKYKEVKCWVPCKVWIETPVTCYEKVTCQKPVTVKVCTYKKEMRQESYQVCSYKCVPYEKQETYCVMKTRQVPVECTRVVKTCVPYEEKVECCRMVCRKYEKQVPCETCCVPCCEHKCHKHKCHKSSCCD